MKYEGVTLDIEAGIAILKLNRPQQLNALSMPMLESMREALAEVSNDNSARVLIITGAGRGFCAGLDTKTLSELEMSQEELYNRMKKTTFSLYDLSIPTIAVVNGVAVGAGVALAMLCDIRIGSVKAAFASGYIRMGLTPDIGSTYSLPRLLGTAKAMEFMLTGGNFDASEAYRIGMLNRLVPEEELDRAAREMAQTIAGGPPITVKLTKQAIREGIRNSLEQQIGLECSLFCACLKTEDHQEAVNAFLEKRPPEYKGR